MAVQDTINKLKNPCLRAALNAMIGGDLAGKIADMIDNIFMSSDQVNLTFKEFSSSSAAPAKTDPIVYSGNGVFNETISLNTYKLQGTSMEYQTVIIIHEIMHAYLNYNNKYRYNQLAQHQEMAEQYVNDMRTYILQIFPNASANDINDLILNGLGDIFVAKPSYWNTLLNEFNTNNVNIQLTKSNYTSTSSYGTRCIN